MAERHPTIHTASALVLGLIFGPAAVKFPIVGLPFLDWPAFRNYAGKLLKSGGFSPTGRNFAAGMSGGYAFVYDPDDDFQIRFNPGLADLELVTDPEDIATLRNMIEDHLRHTGSGPAGQILDNWQQALPRFKKIMPRDYRRVLEERKRREEQQLEEARHG